MTTQPKTTPKSGPASKSRTSRKIKPAAKSGSTELTTVATVPATKRDQLAALLVRDEGATIDKMIATTGWLPHTVRAAMTGLKKLGYAIDSDKIDGLRTYRAVAPK